MIRRVLFYTTALAAIGLASTGYAQAPAGAAAEADSGGIEEVVVTATRQSQAVNRVALSIAAVTQTTLDQQGVKTAIELTKTVPALVLVNSTAGAATFAVRGIVSNVGAATTGVYLDDTALTKRNQSGGAPLNGAPIPLLFDLERVEVLKGPQGTLYGGSSQGGTIRFITPAPSTTDTSGFARAEINQVEQGGIGTEVGAAIGGPIVEDQVGFRVSAVMRNTAGWIDRINGYAPGEVYEKDANWKKEWAFRGALRWEFSAAGAATLSLYHSSFESAGVTDSSTVVYAPNGQRAVDGQTFTTTAVCFDNSNRSPTAGGAPAAVTCPAGPLPAGWFQRQSYTYGPYNLGRYETITPFEQRRTNNSTRNDVLALTIDHRLGEYDLKSITSLIADKTEGIQAEGYDILRTQRVLENPTRSGFPLWAAQPNYAGVFDTNNSRKGWEQEVRLSSSPEDRLSFVAGLFFSNIEVKNDWYVRGNYDLTLPAFFGLTASQRYASQTAAQPGVMSELHATLTDKEAALFGEANYMLFDGLKLTAGLRVSKTEFHFNQANFGLYNVGRPRITSPGAVIDGTEKSSPVTPKIGVQWEFAPNRMIYANRSKGVRAGGLNAPLNPACAPGLAIYGLTVTDIPTGYGPDEVWSSEAGTKLRLLDNKLQVNVAAFQIDWSNIQTTQQVAGCPGWNQNGGTATSKGFDLQTEFRPISPITITFSAGYTDAYYTEDVLGPQGNGQKVVAYNAGDPIGVPKWQGSLGARYEFMLNDVPAYIRADYNYQAPYVRGSSFGTITYQRANRKVGEEDVLNMRMGANVSEALEVNFFINNLLGSHDQIGNGGNGQSSCSASAASGAACTAYSTYIPFVQETYVRPRMIGFQASYRY